MAHLVSPSILSANFLHLQNDVELVNNSEADWLHFDVMDGHFVPNLTFGFPVIRAVKHISKKPLDVHLMITNPQRYITAYRDAGADNLTVHYEVCPNLHNTLQEIKHAGMTAGVSINPHTPVNVLTDIIAEVDVALVMSVNPGFGGQPFIVQSYEKIKQLKKIIETGNSTAQIQVDGGVNLNNAKQLVNCGVDILVSGSAIFKSKNPMETVHQLKKI